MQRTVLDPNFSWINLFYLLVAGFLGWLAKDGYKWVQLWVTRRRTGAEIHESIARARKTEAEARQIELQGNVTAANSVMSMITHMLETQEAINAIRIECEQKDVEIRLMEVQVRRLKGLLDAHGIKYSEVDEQRMLKDDNSQ